jgi:hypothetical protein
MKHLNPYNEGFFDFLRKQSEDDKIVDTFIKRLKRIKGISPYDITFSDSGTEQGEQYWSKYKVEFEDVPFKVVRVYADRKYKQGWTEETQKEWTESGAVKKNNSTFYGIFTFPMGEEVRVTPSLRKIEELFELTEEVYKKDLNARRIKKITDELNPAADRLNTDLDDESIDESIYEREVVFTSKRNPRLEIIVTKSPDGRIVNIENETGMRFPFSVGQILNRTAEVWACNNNLLMDGKDTCPEKKIFGVKTKDVPQGHEWRHIFPNKFR